MKKLALLLAVTFTLANSAFAQNELQLNASNIIFYEVNLSYEHIINDNITLGGFTGYVYGLPDVDEFTGSNVFFYIGPELKYYVYPKNKPASGFYLAIYSKYSNGEAQATDYFDFSGNDEYPISKYNKLAFGFSVGNKWVTDSNVTFGFFGGLDRNIIAKYDNEEYLEYESGGSENEFIGFRLGFNIGYRF